VAEADRADACALPGHIARRCYDLVFSNSVIEHVGGHERRERFAEAVRTLADAYWVQTPYRYFPVEPHWIAPAMQFLPVAARSAIAYRWPLAHTRPVDRADAVASVLWTELLDRTQLRQLLPGRGAPGRGVFGMVKSLLAVKTPRS
jgi:hypothetical protein